MPNIFISRLTCHFKDERECVYFQETTLKSKDSKDRNKRNKIQPRFAHRKVRATNKHDQCISSHLKAAFFNIQIHILKGRQ